MIFDSDEQKEKDKQLAAETLSVQAVYVNKYSFSMADNTIRITFSEDHPSGVSVVRSAVAMSIGGFMALVQMLGPQAEHIKKEFDRHTAAQKETTQ